MKTRKTLFTLSAVCIVAYTILQIVVWQLLVRSCNLIPADVFPLFRGICGVFSMLFFAIGIILAIAGFMVRDERPVSVSNSYRYTTLTLTILIGLALLMALADVVMGRHYMYILQPPTGIKDMCLITGSVWILLLSRQESLGAVSPWMRKILIAGICLLATPFVVGAAFDAISLYTGNEEVFPYYVFFSWVWLFVPAILLTIHCSKLFRKPTKK